MNFQVLSEKAVKEYRSSLPHVCISVRSPGENRVFFPDNRRRLGVLYLEFHDIERSDDIACKFLAQSNIKPVLFSQELAIQIREFVEAHPSAEEIVVNCEAGISRSSGVAAALSKAMTGDDEVFFQQYHPNRLVYKLLRREMAKPSSQP